MNKDSIVKKLLLITMIVATAAMFLQGCRKKSDNKETENISYNTNLSEEASLNDKLVFYKKSNNIIEKYVYDGISFNCTAASTKEIEQLQLDTLLDDRFLVWQDCFNGSELDKTMWSYMNGQINDSELQYYTDSEDNISLKDGQLVINARHETAPDGAKITSGGIETRGTKQFAKGRIELKVRFTNATGQHGDFGTRGAWAGTEWPVCGEINIGGQYGDSDSDYYRLTSAIHYAASDKAHKYESGEAHSYNNQLNDKEYHILAAEWTDDEIKIYVDDDNYSTYNIRDKYYYRPLEKSGAQINPFLMPHYIQLSLAVQAIKNIDKSNPMTMEVDWVRVYAEKDITMAEELVPGKLGIDFLHNIADADKISSSDMEYSADIGEKIYLGAVYLPDTVVDRSCTFAVDNTDAAQISQSGVLTVKGEGRVVVTVMDNNSGVTASRAIIISSK